MSIFIYTSPIPLIISIVLLAICIWSSLTEHFVHSQIATNKTIIMWKCVNAFLCVFSIGIVFYIALFDRSKVTQAIHLIPLRLLLMAKDNPELYRSMFMNVIFFMPFGMTFSSTLSEGIAIRKRVLITAFLGLLISVSIEVLQYVFSRKAQRCTPLRQGPQGQIHCSLDV